MCDTKSVYIYQAHKMEELLKLEAKYGPLPGHSPTIDYVLRSLQQVQHKQCAVCYYFTVSLIFRFYSFFTQTMNKLLP